MFNVLAKSLEGVKVLELATVLAGPLVGSFLSELGASVVKIENRRTGGDVTRHWKTKTEFKGNEFSDYYHSANYNKESISLDFSVSSDLDKAKELVCESDVIISNFQKRVGEKFQLDPFSLKAMNPKAVIVHLNAYDYNDERPGFDMVMQAETGYISMCGTESGEHAKMPVAMIDVLASHQMKEAVLLGLLKQEQTGEGLLYFVSLFKSGISALVNQGGSYINSGAIPSPMGTLHPSIAPYGDVIISKGGNALILAIGSDRQFEKMATLLGMSSEFKLEYSANDKRVLSRKDMMKTLTETSREFGYEELKSLLQNNSIPYGELKNLEQVFQSSLAVEMILENDNLGKTLSQVAFDKQ